MRKWITQNPKSFGLLGLLVLLCLASLFVPACRSRIPAHQPDAAKIPLIYCGGHYYAKVHIQGKEGWMLVDTGASWTMFFRQTRDLIDYSESKITENARFPFFEKAVPARKISVRKVSIGNWQISRLNARILYQDLSLPSVLHGLPVFGILGYDNLRHWRTIHFTRKMLTLSQHPITTPPSVIAFSMKEIGGVPAIVETIQQDKSVAWLVDTGYESHIVSAEAVGNKETLALACSKNCKRCSGCQVTMVQLRNQQGAKISFPAKVVPIGDPPFAEPFRASGQGIIGGTLLNRYKLVIDNREKRIWFVPVVTAESRGTYGLSIINRRGEKAVYLHFVLPQVSETPKTAVRLRAIDGAPVEGLTDWVLKRLFCSQAGTRLRLAVELPSGKRQEVVCEAFAPEEIGINEYWAETRRGSLEFRHTVLSLTSGDSIWTVYPFDIYTYRRGFPALQVVGPGEGVRVRASSQGLAELHQRGSEQEQRGARKAKQATSSAESRSPDLRERKKKRLVLEMDIRYIEHFICGHK